MSCFAKGTLEIRNTQSNTEEINSVAGPRQPPMLGDKISLFKVCNLSVIVTLRRTGPIG